MKKIYRIAVVFWSLLSAVLLAKDDLWTSIEKNNKKKLTEILAKINPSNKGDLNKKGPFGQTPVMLAVNKGNHEALKMLLEKSPDLTIKDNFSMTVLHHAIMIGDCDGMRMLLSTEDAPINAKNAYGETPLILAAKEGDTSIVNLLISYDKQKFSKDRLRQTIDLKSEKVKLDEKDSNGKTALMHAAESGHKDAVNSLVNAGVNTKEQDNDGNTALDLAKNGFKEAKDEMKKATYDVIIILLS